MPAQQVGYGPLSGFGGSLPDSFMFKRSGLNPQPTAQPVRGTSAYGAPGVNQPQTSNIVPGGSGTPDPSALATQQVASGPMAQPAFIALVTLVIGVFILAVVAHVEA